ncbi:SHC SH2 domain-binding protein 1 isoform X2 [Cololabis saira]|uniref:SHC SH2 domain-binding protein 1 isoform X2 n=1 Tax=Cololabis saira TaxID=129043 RepID=UPI002AD4D2F9|nr:SHC SH2 domain-binding protein 1 isoform X2 [Cololabis saira]
MSVFLVVEDVDPAVAEELLAEGAPAAEAPLLLNISRDLFQNGNKSMEGGGDAEDNDEGEEDDDDDDEDDDGDDDSGTDNLSSERSGTKLQRCQQGETSNLPDTFQTSNLLFYERFKTYQDYMLGDCKPSEVKPFIADFLGKVLEPSDWFAVWRTDVFDVLVEVRDLDVADLKACVTVPLPLRCDTRGCDLTVEIMTALLEATRNKVSLRELYVLYDESGDFDQTALALEHLRFFYRYIWRQWDDDEDDDFDYFVRRVEPRLRLHYDILENRVSADLVEEYVSLLKNCAQCFREFCDLRNSVGPDSDSELDNVSMVEALKLYDQLEMFKRKLHIIENPLLRHVLTCKGNSRQQCVQSRGPRQAGAVVVHVVMGSCDALQLESLLSVRLKPMCSSTKIQFYTDPVSAVESCHEGEAVIILPGIYTVSSSIVIADSISIEGFGDPDEVVIEKTSKGDSFVKTTGNEVRLSNIKFIQHDAIEGILCVYQGTLNMDNCVLQCETTGVIVWNSARLTMNECDLYGSKGAGLEIYPGSVCSLVGNSIHHCKDGILIKDYASELAGMPSVTMEKNSIYNNEGYGVILVKPGDGEESSAPADKPADPAVQTPVDQQQEGVAEPQISSSAVPQVASSTSSSWTLSGSSSAVSQVSYSSATSSSSLAAFQVGSAEAGAGAEADPASSTGRKWHFSRPLSRTREATCSRPAEDLMEHPIFVSVKENQFKRNGKGDFGTFFY